MRTLAAFVVAICTAHLPLCMLADDHARESAHHDSRALLAHDHETPDGAPARDPEPGESCVDHCEKLMQGVPKSAPSLDLSFAYSIVAVPVPWDMVQLAAREGWAGGGRNDRAPPPLPLRRDVLRL